MNEGMNVALVLRDIFLMHIAAKMHRQALSVVYSQNNKSTSLLDNPKIRLPPASWDF